MKTITAANANRGFSSLLREVRNGETVTILSRGNPVAVITSVTSMSSRRNAMKKLLLSRLHSRVVTGERNWTRNELYDDESCA